MFSTPFCVYFIRVMYVGIWTPPLSYTPILMIKVLNFQTARLEKIVFYHGHCRYCQQDNADKGGDSHAQMLGVVVRPLDHPDASSKAQHRELQEQVFQ